MKDTSKPRSRKQRLLKSSRLDDMIYKSASHSRKELKGLGKHIPLGDPSGALEGSLGYVDHTVSMTRPKAGSPANSLLPLSLPSPDTSHTGLHSSLLQSTEIL